MRLSFGKPFYGWAIVGVGALVAFGSGPGQSYTFSVFLDHMIEDTGFSRTHLSTLYAVGTGLSAAMVMVVSRMADRYGPRLMIILAATCLTIACFGMSFAVGGWSFFAAFAALRALGQGSLPINATLVTAQWFVTMRGRAMAVMGLGFSVAMASLPVLSRTLVESVGWREAYAYLGVLIWVMVVPATALILRNMPEDMGLYPDGADHPPEEEAEGSIYEEDKRKVLTSPTFWALAIPLCTSPFVSTALIFHQVAIFAERGLSYSLAAGVFVPLSIASILASLVAGVIADRVGPKELFFLQMFVLLIGTICVLFIGSYTGALLYAAILGSSNGMGRIVTSVIWAHLYGRYRLGRIQGSATMVMITASALGPLPLAVSQGITGSFTAGIWLMALLPVAATAVVASIRLDKVPYIGSQI